MYTNTLQPTASTSPYPDGGGTEGAFPDRAQAEAEQAERQMLTALAVLGLGGLAVAGALILRSKSTKKEDHHD